MTNDGDEGMATHEQSDLVSDGMGGLKAREPDGQHTHWHSHEITNQAGHPVHGDLLHSHSHREEMNHHHWYEEEPDGEYAFEGGGHRAPTTRGRADDHIEAHQEIVRRLDAIEESQK